jgi:hypothetical protein
LARRKYELVLVIEADTGKAGRAAADAAWNAATKTAGPSIKDSLIRERLADGTKRDPGWSGWDAEASLGISVSSFGP